MPDDLSPSDLAAQVGADLFPRAENNAGAGGSTAEAAPAAPPSLATATAAPAPAPRALPKAWKKEMEPHWAKLDPVIHDYVYEREGNVEKGINTYKQGFESWKSFTEPFLDVLQKYPDVDPVALASNLMRSHMALTFGDAEQKKVLAQQLLQSYGIDMGSAPPPAVPNELLQRVSTLESSLRQQAVNTQLSVVQKFFADPANKYAEELGEDIFTLIKQGVAPDLPAAYEKAKWLNPAVREKLLAESAKPAAPSPAAQLNLRHDDANPTPAPRKGTWEDTIKSVVSKHYPSH